jgi:lipopolysaccharide export LptBFGC system permease protein LptF
LTIQSKDGGVVPHGGGIELSGVTIEENRSGRRRSIEAERAVIEVARGDTIASSAIEIDTYDVRVSDGTTFVERPKETLPAVVISPELADRIEALTDQELLSPKTMAPDDPLYARRADALEARGETIRRIVGAMNERLAFSVSVLVLVILGAALGIIFRGAHVMTAFGISFVPTLFVIVTIVTGKQMSHNAGTYGLGISVMWSGIVVVAALDVWTLMRVLRR